MEHNNVPPPSFSRDESDDSASVPAYRDMVDNLLDFATTLKAEQAIEPPLSNSDFGDRIRAIYDSLPPKENKLAHYAAIETAFRDKFYDLIASTLIDDPAFVQVWNLLDILSIFSDNEQCEPGLIFWLIEELLDSQTIGGCRNVFDYLESRRERITAKHFKQKNLIILRSCNELLRRLSRAEDTVFCGRVFIFLFQSFPLGDKSSVNLRGEYHTENVTTFDDISSTITRVETPMEVDTPVAKEQSQEDTTQKDSKVPEKVNGVITTSSQATASAPKAEVTEAKSEADSPPLTIDELYPLFWKLQEGFSAPTQLFVQDNFESFKKGLEATIHTFKNVNSKLETRATLKSADEFSHGVKRKHFGDGEEAGSSFNPKYLTSRDLFELEINDVAFRRHIMVQALIILDFLLSLTTKSKAAFADMTNKSVLYTHTLKDEDAKWALQTKNAIVSYLQSGKEGAYYKRMVDTVLSRDRNWVRWKALGCPPIEEKPVTLEQTKDAESIAHKLTTNKRLRATPLGSLNLQFLSRDYDTRISMLKDPERSSLPTIDSFLISIANDDLDIEMAMTDEDKGLLTSLKASKMWKALRIASKSKLNLFDKLEDGKNLKILSDIKSEVSENQVENAENAENVGNEENGVVSEDVIEEQKDDVVEEQKEEVPV